MSIPSKRFSLFLLCLLISAFLISCSYKGEYESCQQGLTASQANLESCNLERQSCDGQKEAIRAEAARLKGTNDQLEKDSTVLRQINNATQERLKEAQFNLSDCQTEQRKLHTALFTVGVASLLFQIILATSFGFFSKGLDQIKMHPAVSFFLFLAFLTSAIAIFFSWMF